MSSITVTVRYFGPARDLAGNRSRDAVQVPGPIATVRTVLGTIETLHGVAKEGSVGEMVRSGRFGVAVNGEYVDIEGDGGEVADGDEVLVIPPVSSG